LEFLGQPGGYAYFAEAPIWDRSKPALIRNDHLSLQRARRAKRRRPGARAGSPIAYWHVAKADVSWIGTAISPTGLENLSIRLTAPVERLMSYNADSVLTVITASPQFPLVRPLES
jgi:hypothetical protein